MFKKPLWRFVRGHLILASATVLALSSAQAMAVQCSYNATNDWGSGFTASITVSNDSASSISNWSVSWQQNGNSTVTSLWNANLSGSNPYTATPHGWNSTIAPGSTV